jgi:hypothetical protein
MSEGWISFDPGKTTGVTVWGCNSLEEEPQCISVHQLNQEELDNFLDQVEMFDPSSTKAFIIEEYIIFGHKKEAHVGSKVETIQVIGQLKAFARKYKIKVVEQPARILTIAQLWSGCKIPSDHSISHWASAYNHAYYYLHKQGLIKARVLESDK